MYSFWLTNLICGNILFQRSRHGKTETWNCSNWWMDCALIFCHLKVPSAANTVKNRRSRSRDQCVVACFCCCLALCYLWINIIENFIYRLPIAWITRSAILSFEAEVKSQGLFKKPGMKCTIDDECMIRWSLNLLKLMSSYFEVIRSLVSVIVCEHNLEITGIL